MNQWHSDMTHENYMLMSIASTVVFCVAFYIVYKLIKRK